MKVIRRVEMRTVMRHQADPFDRPALAVGQILLAQTGEELRNIPGRVAVFQVIDARAVTRRVGDDIVLDRDRQVDDTARHRVSIS